MRIYYCLVVLVLFFNSCKKEEVKKADPLDNLDAKELAARVKGKTAFKAVQALRRRCNSEDKEACFYLGQAMEAWKQRGTERASAEKWYAKACDLKDGKACFEAGRFNTLGSHGAPVVRKTGLKFFDRACMLKVSAGCVWRDYLTGLWEDGPARTQMTKKLNTACSAQDLLACSFAGRLMGLSAKTVGELEKVHSMLSKACREKSVRACTYLGEFLEKNRDMNTSGAAMTGHLERGCKQGVPEGCLGLAKVFMEQAGEMKYTPKVVELMVEACMLGELNSCATLSTLYYDGKVLPVSYESSLFYARRGCSGGNGGSCLLAARIFRFGQGIKPNFDESLRYLKESCSLRNWEACIEAGQIFLNSPKPYHNVKAAIDLFDKGCKNKNLPSCAELGIVFEGTDPAKAKVIHEAACEKGELRSCNRLGTMLLADEASLKKHGKLARKIFEKTCNLKDGEGCFQLGSLYERGIGVPKSHRQMITLTKKACELKHADACGKLSFMDFKKHEGKKGEVASKSKGKAAFIMQQACDNGSYRSSIIWGRPTKRMETSCSIFTPFRKLRRCIPKHAEGRSPRHVRGLSESSVIGLLKRKRKTYRRRSVQNAE
ncbi:sel1 repeat family protein [Myxococcota bacterium]|nr:sel1 repeat family protein [Myxococcota bacterium]MBU1534328.1 sel1 repeat family protein [Myxococcota bacterium]